jgi:polyribonucleotide nucleotidyltransferase
MIKIEADFSVKVDIEQDGRIFVAATDQLSGQQAVKVIQDITRDLQVGEVYLGRVARIVPFGAFIELVPGRDGLLHISQVSRERIERVEDVLKLGDEIEVRIIEIDPQGKVRLSRKEAVRPIEAAPPRDRDRGGDAVATAAAAGGGNDRGSWPFVGQVSNLPRPRRGRNLKDTEPSAPELVTAQAPL